MNFKVFRALMCGALLLLDVGRVATADEQQEDHPTAPVRLFNNPRAAEISIPDAGLNAVIRDTLRKPAGPLTDEDMLNLTNLSGISRGIASLQGLGAAHNLEVLLLDDNHLTNSPFFAELSTLNNLSVLDLSENPFTELELPPGLTNLTRLRIEAGHLTRIALPAGLTKLTELRLGSNRLTDLPFPEGMTNLSLLSVYLNELSDLALPGTLSSLTQLYLDGNHFAQIALPSGLTSLTNLLLGGNQLTSLTVPSDMTNLVILRLNDNQLTNLTLPAGLERLVVLFLLGNHLHDFALPSGLSNLGGLYLTGNQLTNLTIPSEVTQLSVLLLDRNPLTTLVLPELLTPTLATFLDLLRTQDVSIFTYPLAPQLVRPRALVGSGEFGIVGPPGAYFVLHSTNLVEWNVVGTVTNTLGSVNFIDLTANSSPHKFYRSFLQSPPANDISNHESR